MVEAFEDASLMIPRSLAVEGVAYKPSPKICIAQPGVVEEDCWQTLLLRYSKTFLPDTAALKAPIVENALNAS